MDRLDAPALLEGAEPGQGQVEARRADGGQGGVHLLRQPSFDLANEAERQVVVLGRDPFRPGDAAG